MSPELIFVDMTVELLDAAVADQPQLGRLLGATVAEGWEGFPDALPVLRESEKRRQAPTPFRSFFFLLAAPRTLVGMGGFKSEPTADGTVELGYAIAPAFRNQGLATEAVRLMLERAFVHAPLDAVLASTLAGPNASTRVLEKAGFVRAGEITDPDEGTVWQWRCPRSNAPR